MYWENFTYLLPLKGHVSVTWEQTKISRFSLSPQNKYKDNIANFESIIIWQMRVCNDAMETHQFSSLETVAFLLNIVSG